MDTQQLDTVLNLAKASFGQSLNQELASFTAGFLRSNPKVSGTNFVNMSRTQTNTYRSAVKRAMKVSTVWSTVPATNAFSVNTTIGDVGQDAINMPQQSEPFLVDAFYFNVNDDMSLADWRLIEELGRVRISCPQEGFRDIVLNASDCFVNPLTQQSASWSDQAAAPATGGANANGLIRSGGQTSPWTPIPGLLGLLANQKATITIEGLGGQTFSSTVTLQLNLRGRVGY